MNIYVLIFLIFTSYAQSKSLDEVSPETPSLSPKTPSSSIENVTSLPENVTQLLESMTTSLPVTTLPRKPHNQNVSFIDNLSNQISIVLKHFQNPDPVGIPGDNILPEPLPAANVTASLVVANGFFYNITVLGMNNFTIDVVQTYLDKMQVLVTIKLKQVTALGNYTISNLFADNHGPFNITFFNVTATGVVGLASDQEGKLYVNQSSIDISYEDLDVNLTNVSTIIRPFLNTGGAAVFMAEKPLILENVNQILMAEINKRLEIFPKIPPLSKLSPVDLAIIEGRKFVKSKYEPFIISKVFDFDSNFLKVNVGPVAIHGIHKFARVGNITLDMVNQTVDLRVRLITSKLYGKADWYYDFGKIGITRHGHSNFSVEHLQFEAKVHQPVDSRKSPVLQELDIELGPIIVKMDGLGGFDYIVERVVQLLPKLLRLMIIDALEIPLKEKIQTDILDKINVEQVYEENLPDIKKYLSDKI